MRRAAAEDAAALAADLRPADRRELAALGRAPLEALEEALAVSLEPFAAVDGSGRLIALFGVVACPEAPEIGAPWMLASPGLDQAARPFLRVCRGWTDHLAAPFALLANRVDERNRVHIRWLAWCGFTFLRRVALGPQQRPFLEFARLGPGGAAAPPAFNATFDRRM